MGGGEATTTTKKAEVFLLKPRLHDQEREKNKRREKTLRNNKLAAVKHWTFGATGKKTIIKTSCSMDFTQLDIFTGNLVLCDQRALCILLMVTFESTQCLLFVTYHQALELHRCVIWT